MAKAEMPDVRVGDVWQDLDQRSNDRNGNPRRIRIEAVWPRRVTGSVTHSGRPVDIARSRMRPTATGYKLVERDGKAVNP